MDKGMDFIDPACTFTLARIERRNALYARSSLRMGVFFPRLQRTEENVAHGWNGGNLPAFVCRPLPLHMLSLLFSLIEEQCMKGVALRWCWWQERNKTNHQERRLSEEEFSFQVQCHTNEWKSIAHKSTSCALS